MGTESICTSGIVCGIGQRYKIYNSSGLFFSFKAYFQKLWSMWKWFLSKFLIKSRFFTTMKFWSLCEKFIHFFPKWRQKQKYKWIILFCRDYFCFGLQNHILLGHDWFRERERLRIKTLKGKRIMLLWLKSGQQWVSYPIPSSNGFLNSPESNLCWLSQKWESLPVSFIN